MLHRGIKKMQAKSLAKDRGEYQSPREKVTKLLPTRENQGRKIQNPGGRIHERRC